MKRGILIVTTVIFVYFTGCDLSSLITLDPINNDVNPDSINPDGTLKWKYTTGDWVSSSPAIGPDGTIYVGSNDNNLYAIYGSGTLASTSWPMFHHDLKHTGRVGGP